MQALGRRYVAAFNLRAMAAVARCGKGRFRANLVAGSDWVLACLRYVELNPGAHRALERSRELALVQRSAPSRAPT